NKSEFASNALGTKTAGKTFFNKGPHGLSMQESARMGGLLKAPIYYSPMFNPEKWRGRRNVVLNQMQTYGFSTPSQYDTIKQLPIELEYSVASHNRGLATYFREVVRADLTKWARENLKADGKPYDLYGDGLRIYTTID